MKRVFFLGWLIFLIFLNIGVYAQMVREWVGPVNGTWNTLGNWSPASSINGARLEFKGVGLSPSINDSSLSFSGLIFSGPSSYTINGNPIYLMDLSIGTYGRLVNKSNGNQTINATISFTDWNKNGVIYDSANGDILLKKLILGDNLAGLLMYGENATKLISIEDTIFGSKKIIIGLSDSGYLKPNTRVRFKGSNTEYTGEITIQGGGLHMEKAPGIQSKIEVKNGAMLTISWGKDVKGQPIYILGEGINLGGAIVSRGGVDTILNDIVFNGSARIAVSKGISSSLVLSKIISTTNSTANLLFDSATNNDNAQFGKITVTDTIGTPALPFLNLSKEAKSTLTLLKQCYYTGYTRVGKGTLQLGDNNVLPFTTMLDLYKDDCIFSTGATIGFSQTFASLAVFAQTHTPTINLGTGVHTITFGSSRDQLWWQNIPSTQHIRITGWKGSPGASGTEGRIFFNSVGSIPGLTQTQLDRIRWIDIPGVGNTTIGARLLATGELVPSNLPIITSLITDIPSSSRPANSGYIGTTVTLNGQRFLSVIKLLIGGVEVPIITPLSATTLKFKVNINTSGSIQLITSTDTVTYASPFVNLGYVTRVHKRIWSDLSAPGTWLEPVSTTPEIVPIANKSVTIADSSITINALAAVINPSILDSNTLTIKSGLAAGAGRNNASLQLAADQLIDLKTHVVFDSGQLRMYNSESRINATLLSGVNQEFNTLKLLRNTSISLGKNAHTLRFAPSNLVSWNDSATVSLTIFNWEGSNETSGTAGKIFFGDKDTTLTEQQLLQIKFAGRCGPAKLLADGELVPSNDPFFSSVTSDVGTGPFTGYIGSTVTITGCQLSDVIKVKIGLWEGVVFDKSASSLKFIVDKDTQNDFIELITSGSDTGKSRIVFRNLGYTNKISGDWETATTWVGDVSPTTGKKVTIKSSTTVVISSVLTEVPDSLVLADPSILQLKGNSKLLVDKAIIINSVSRIEMVDSDNSILEMNGPGVFTNLSLLNNFTKGTIIFNNKISLANSTRAITFNNLKLNADTLTLSSNGGRLPTINGELTMNGGTIIQSNQNGPLYASGSKLIYASGTSFDRGIEWNANGVLFANQRGLPRKVVIENGTTLNLTPLPSGSENLLLNGDLEINKGKLINNLGTPLNVIGDLYIGNDNNSFSELELMNGGLYLQGDFNKYLNSSFTSSSQEVFLIGNQSISITANNHPDSSDPSNIGFDLLSINKNAVIKLNSSIKVNDNINFGLGIVLSDSSHFLQIENNGSSTGGSLVSFVDGPVKKVTSNVGLGSNDFEFKIGKVLPSPVYKPVWIADLQPNGTTTFAAEYFPSSTTAMPTFSGSIFIDPILTGIWANEWWNIDRSGMGKARVGIYYLPVPASSWEPTAPCSDCNVGVVHYNFSSSSWEFTKSSGDFNNATPPYFEAILNSLTSLVYADVETNFSPFTIGFSFPSVLPIRLTNFSAQLQNGNGLINWQVSDISTIKYFEVEHSSDGLRFQRLSSIIPSENNTFQYIDKNLTSGIHYYRLKMYEKNGRYNYSRIEWIQVGTDQTIIAGLLQNPVGGGKAIVKLYSANAQTADAMVIDRSGRVMFRQNVTMQKGNNQVNISVLPLSPGSYFLKLRTKDGEEKVMPFLK